MCRRRSGNAAAALRLHYPVDPAVRGRAADPCLVILLQHRQSVDHRGNEGDQMAGIRIASLPATAKTVLRPMVIDSPADGPYHEVAGVRVRRTSAFLHLEGPMEVGGWCNWYVDLTPGLERRASLVNMHQAMVMSRVLARRAPRSAAATIVEKAAPNAIALARHYQAKVGGVDAAVMHFRIRNTTANRPTTSG